MTKFNIIKLDAIGSTNDWFKNKFQSQKCQDGDVVWAMNQTRGKSIKDVWLTLIPIPIIDPLKIFPLIIFSIKTPPIFLLADKMSFGHLIFKLGILNFSSVLIIANVTAKLIKKDSAEFNPEKRLNTLNVIFL